MKDKIFNQIRKYKITSGQCWTFQQYHGAFAANMNSVERNEFNSVMNELCNKGTFKSELDGTFPRYTLTKQGENEIYSV